MYVNRALARIEVKNYSGAIEDCDKAIAIDFLLAEAYFVRGYVNHLVKENIKSLEDFDQAILLDPSHVDAFYNRAVVKKDLKDFVGACKDLEVAIQLGYSKAEYKKTEFCK
jgi:tetratricopeptide (TPR) repeat protein